MTSEKRHILVYMVLIAIGLVGCGVSLCGYFRGSGGVSGRSEEVFEKALQNIDSIFEANEKNPDKYAEFKRAASSLSMEDLESEAYKMVPASGKSWNPEYYYRALVERYDADMPLRDKLLVVKSLNNLGCVFSNNNNLAAAYSFFKTGYEMDRALDEEGKIRPALLCNMAGVYKIYGDDQTANTMYLEAVERAYSPDYNPVNIRIFESARIQTLIEYLQYAWLTDKLVERRSDYERFLGKLPHSVYEHYPYARYLCEAVDAYVGGKYHRSVELLDSACNSTDFSFAEMLYVGQCQLFKADAMFHAKDYSAMKLYLDKAEDLIAHNNLIYLLPDLYKGRSAYSLNIGDSIAAEAAHARELAVCDSLFNSRNYAALRDAQSDWDRVWYDVKVEQTRKTMLWLGLSVFFFILAVAGAVCVVKVMKRHGNLADTLNDAPTDAPIDAAGESAMSGNVVEETIMEPGAETLAAAEFAVGDALAPDEAAADEVGGDSAESNVSGEESEESFRSLYEEIEMALAKSPDVFDVDFSINAFAKETGVSARRISRAVNVCSGMNFSSFLAAFRVKAACRILDSVKNPWERPTTDALAQMVGYRSRAHLTRVFKAVIGMSPTEYANAPRNKKNINDK